VTADAVPGDLFGDTTAQPSPIGVPKGYSVVKPVKAGIGSLGRAFQRGTHDYQQTPRYVQGHQYNPASLPVDDIIDLQESLVAAGLMERGDYTVGVWDNESTQAYEHLLSEANASGDDETTAMTRRIQSVQVNGAPGAAKAPKRQPLVVTLTNPEDLRAVAKRVSTELYGGRLPDEELDRFVANYQASEANYQQAGYAMDETGGTLTKPADPESVLENQIKTEHPNEYMATQFGAKMDQVIAKFTGGM
jgi:hypothetical protein